MHDFGGGGENPQTPQEYFKVILMTVVGRAFDAAGYVLEDRPMQWAGGLFRFKRRLDVAHYAFIEYQLLAYVDSEWAAGMPSRFRVTLSTSSESGGGVPIQRKDLGTLVVDDFGVPILPSGNHWWTFRNIDELGKALAEAGHLVVGYGMPWLAGELTPPSEAGDTAGE